MPPLESNRADEPAVNHRPAESHLSSTKTVLIDRIPVHLMSELEAVGKIMDAAGRHSKRPLGVVSVNLDHIHYFGASANKGGKRVKSGLGNSSWLNLIDGAPIASQVKRMTGDKYPKLSGSDLVEPVLDEASKRGLSLAVVGGSAEVTPSLEAQLATRWPGIILAGHWAPDRRALASATESHQLAHAIRAAQADIVLVCLGKPRQEEWIAAYGAETGAGVLLAFGAVVDFLAGRVSRAPKWVSSAGLEWLWRLGREPKRLARRYLVEGPPAYVAVRRSR